ncbi:MAG: plasmid pRiA4b ORF-3 family protein [Kribbellaceae bacterium]
MDTETLQLPTVRLAPYDELARAVRGCERLRSVRRLAEWVGPSRKITKSTGTLTLADARKAVQALHLPGDQGPGRTPARSAMEFTELQDLWELAREAELLQERDGTVRPGPALDVLLDDDDEEIVDVWADFLDVTLERAFWLPVLSRALVPTLMAMYVSPAPVPRRELADMVAELTADRDDEFAVLAEINGAVPDLDEFLRELVNLGAATSDDDDVCLTLLGRYGVNAWLEAVGVEAPYVTDLGDATAAELIELGYTATGPDELDALFSEWTSARGQDRAAGELVAYAAGGDAQQRMTAFSLLDRIGPPAEDAVRRGLETAVTRPHARAWLTVRGLDGGEPDIGDVRWLFVDALLAVQNEDVDAIRQSLSELDLPAEMHADLVADLWRSDHPQKVEALETLAKHHPDPAVVLVARKSLLQARSPAPAARRTASNKVQGTPKSAKARAKAKTAAAKAAFASSVCQLKITLLDLRPPVWRRISVPATITLPELHAAIQTAMGWTDSHLHEFEIDGIGYGEPDPDSISDLVPEAGVRLLDKVREGGRLKYVYDFGDDWRHDIEVEKVVPGGVEVPVCLAGRRRCPPEDVGGPWGYTRFLEAYRDPADPEHDEMRQWGGAGFDPDHFDAAEVTAELAVLFR